MEKGVMSAMTENKKKILKELIMRFETGTLSKDEIEAILDTLPVDITLSIKKTLSDTSASPREESLCGQRRLSAEKSSNATHKRAST